MPAPKIALILFVLFLNVTAAASARSEGLSADEARVLELVDEMKEVIHRWERNPSANPLLLNEFREVVRRYDWPWRVRLLVEDFRDGNYTADPAWVVRRGDFRIIPGGGLETLVGLQTITRPSSGERTGDPGPSEIYDGILKGRFEAPVFGNEFREPVRSSEISTAVALGNAFAIIIRMASRESTAVNSRVEFGPYRGDRREWGFRLAYNPGQRPSFEILRLSPGRTVVVESYDVFSNLEDSKTHKIEWRRDRDGAMLVLLDDREIIRAVDRIITDFFDGFTVVNKGGDYVFERIEIFGIER
jgi:hypothetical protein